MGTQLSRACLLIIVLVSFLMLCILGAMMFSKNIEPDIHIPFWVAAMSVSANTIFFIAIARFLWYQDQYLKMMAEFYPIVNRIREVVDVKGGK